MQAGGAWWQAIADRTNIQYLALDRRSRLRETLQVLGETLRHAGRLNPRRAHPNTYQRLLDPDGTALT